MQERTRHLKIKIQSLVDESRNIRREARKVKGMERWNLNNHRTGVVRVHTRVNLLAYGILRNIPYEAMERKCCEMMPNFEKVAKIAKSFGASEENVVSWVDNAKAYLSAYKKAA